MQISFSQPTVDTLLKTAQYRVPRFQRGYAWSGPQVDAFWADITGMRKGDGYFLGPMVVHQTGGHQVRELIDGQQRLTTIVMLLALIRDAYIQLDDPMRDGGEKSSAAPQTLIRKGGYVNRFTLHSGEPNRRVLEDFVLRLPSDEERKDLASKKDREKLGRSVLARNKALLDARERLRGHIDRLLDNSDREEKVKRLRALETALVHQTSVALLDVASLNDAFLLFETLNERGLRLSSADLLKSHLLARFDKETDDARAMEAAADQWDDMVEALGGGDISGFLRHFLLMKHERVTKSDVFPLFKKDVDAADPRKALDEITSMGEVYARIVHPPTDDETSFEILTRLNQTSVDTHRIALLPALAFLDLKRFVVFARVTEILSFRWVITGGNAQVLETIYQQAAAKLQASRGEAVDEAQALLVDRLPADDVFESAFAAYTGGYLYVAAYALRRIENAWAPSEKAIKSAASVHVEHIMPRTATLYWTQRETDDSAYEEVVERWGNLTLLDHKLNAAVSNGNWQTKKRGTEKHPGYEASRIELTRDLLDFDDWTSQDIDVRGRWLARVAARVWSLEPDLKGIPKLREFAQNSALGGAAA